MEIEGCIRLVNGNGKNTIKNKLLKKRRRALGAWREEGKGNCLQGRRGAGKAQSRSQEGECL